MKILPEVEHIVVVMFENRSFDQMLGGLYPSGTGPRNVLPAGSSPALDGWHAGLSNPSNPSAFAGGPPEPRGVTLGASNLQVPNPDPQETFEHVTFQLFGPQGPSREPAWPMQGFLIDYASTAAPDAGQILQCYDAPSQLPVLATLARAYAVSDAWFSSVPSQTWPNRAFAHAGTSNGRVDNGEPPDPLEWDVPTIFNVLEAIDVDWGVYSDTILTPSLTRTMFPKLWVPWLSPHFKRFDDFVADCANGALPAYSFIEPSFLQDPNDHHPPHDTAAGEAFLHAIWSAVSTSPRWTKTLLVITFDEHGGGYDHVLPPFGAEPPDARSSPGDAGFGFDRFGVRVPAVVVSPYIEAGTVFRSPSATPYDHTSILATLRDWIGIAPSQMLDSRRVAAAPTLAPLLTRLEPRTDLPSIAAPAALRVQPAMTEAPNDLQRSLVAGSARRFGMDPQAAVQAAPTRQHAVDFLRRHNGHEGA